MRKFSFTEDEKVKAGLRLPADPPVVELHRWHLVFERSGVARLHGFALGHPRLRDGPIKTTRLTGRRAGMVATRRSLYLLRAPDPTQADKMIEFSLKLIAELPCV